MKRFTFGVYNLMMRLEFKITKVTFEHTQWRHGGYVVIVTATSQLSRFIQQVHNLRLFILNIFFIYL